MPQQDPWWFSLLPRRTGSPVADALLPLAAAFARHVHDRQQPVDPFAVRGQATEPKVEIRIMATPDEFWQRVVSQPYGLYLVAGRPGSGKTAFSFKLAQELHRPLWAIGIPADILGRWGKAIKPEQITDVPDGSTILIDDAGLMFGAMDYNREASQRLHDIISIRRQRRLVIIANTVNTGVSDRYLLEADAVFCKPPSLLFSETERTKVSQLMREVKTAFSGMDELEVKRHMYCASDVFSFVGMIEYGLPRGWNESISFNKASGSRTRVEEGGQ